MKRCRITMPILLACLIALTLVSISFGWIKNAWPSTIQFAAGSTPEYPFYKITFPKEGGDNAAAVVTSPSTIGTSADKFAFSGSTELQFGTIRNLHILENDNYVFYAVEIPYSMGTEVHAAISYGSDQTDANGNDLVPFGEHFKLYTEEFAEITDSTDTNGSKKHSDVRDIETRYGKTFVTYACVLSTTPPSSTMKFGDLNKMFEGKEMLSVATMTKVNESDTAYTPSKNSVNDQFVDTVAAQETGSYYLYIKLQPNMELYKYFVDILYADMPFYLAYQVAIQFYVTPAPNS